MMPRIAKATAEPNFLLRIEWQDGRTDVIDFKPIIAQGGVMTAWPMPRSLPPDLPSIRMDTAWDGPRRLLLPTKSAASISAPKGSGTGCTRKI